MLHKIKILPQFVAPILSGDKRFEVRNNDRCYNKGDTIRFTVVGDRDEMTSELQTACDVLEANTYEVTYVVSGYGLKNGYVAFGIRELV